MATPNLWGELAPGDEFVCPGSGRIEKVLSVRPYRGQVGGRRVFVRTDRHDHIRPGLDPVEAVMRCTACGEPFDHKDGCGNA